MPKRKLEDIVAVLERSTPPAEVSWLPRGVKPKGQSTTEGVATAIPYVDSAYVERTLDEVAGPFGWQTDLKQIAGVMCMGVGIKDPETQEWVWRWDVGLEKSQDEHGSKSEVTGALKRAARQWGIGRDLKNYPKPRAACRIWKGNDGKYRFNSWIGDPGQAALAGKQPAGGAATSVVEPTVEQQAGQKTGNLPQPTAADVSGNAEDMTPIEARTMVFRYAVKEIDYSEQAASAWIRDQEAEHGKDVPAYRLMYGLLVEIKKNNAPPEDWQPGQEEKEEASA
jgi:hypothetical protein